MTEPLHSVIEDELLVRIGQLTHKIDTGLENIIRWGKYVERGATPENDLVHSYNTAILSILVIESFLLSGHDLGEAKYEILACSILHDIGEIGVGDTLYRQKTEEKDNHEMMSYLEIMGKLPLELQDAMLRLFLLQHAKSPRGNELLGRTEGVSEILDKTNGEASLIFEFIERLGYTIYAIKEYLDRRDQNSLTLLLHVLRNQHSRLCNIADKYEPIRKWFYTERMISYINEILKIYEGKYIEDE